MRTRAVEGRVDDEVALKVGGERQGPARLGARCNCAGRDPARPNRAAMRSPAAVADRAAVASIPKAHTIGRVMASPLSFAYFARARLEERLSPKDRMAQHGFRAAWFRVSFYARGSVRERSGRLGKGEGIAAPMRDFCSMPGLWIEHCRSGPFHAGRGLCVARAPPGDAAGARTRKTRATRTRASCTEPPTAFTLARKARHLAPDFTVRLRSPIAMLGEPPR